MMRGGGKRVCGIDGMHAAMRCSRRRQPRSHQAPPATPTRTFFILPLAYDWVRECNTIQCIIKLGRRKPSLLAQKKGRKEVRLWVSPVSADGNPVAQGPRNRLRECRSRHVELSTFSVLEQCTRTAHCLRQHLGSASSHYIECTNPRARSLDDAGTSRRPDRPV